MTDLGEVVSVRRRDRDFRETIGREGIRLQGGVGTTLRRELWSKNTVSVVVEDGGQTEETLWRIF